MQVLLIDAYNLLHQSDLLGRGRGALWLERARQRLIRQLALLLDRELAMRTTLVFDAHWNADPGVTGDHDTSIDVRYAVEYPEADDLIEELIARHPAPKQLTVVSSDHRLQRAAARRGASFVDADRWYERLSAGELLLGIPWPPAPGRDATDGDEGDKPRVDSALQPIDPQLANPFPDGYGEDLL